jgi:hypothetical protein
MFFQYDCGVGNMSALRMQVVYVTAYDQQSDRLGYFRSCQILKKMLTQAKTIAIVGHISDKTPKGLIFDF